MLLDADRCPFSLVQAQKLSSLVCATLSLSKLMEENLITIAASSALPSLTVTAVMPETITDVSRQQSLLEVRRS